MCCCLQDNAQFGDHIWFETSGSGDFCYVGEQFCVAKSLVSHSSPLWLNQKKKSLSKPPRVLTACSAAAKVSGEEEVRRVQDLRPHHVHGAAGEGLENLEGLGMARGPHSPHPLMSLCTDQLQVQAVLQGTRFSIRPRGQRSILSQGSGQKRSLLS